MNLPIQLGGFKHQTPPSKSKGFITILEGLEASIGWAGILYEKGDSKNGTSLRVINLGLKDQ